MLLLWPLSTFSAVQISRKLIRPRDFAHKLTAGTVHFFRDMGKWFRLRKSTESSLSYAELRLVKEAPKIMVRMAPFMFHPLPPPCGLIMLSVASMVAPRLLLTHHFHSATEIIQFAAADAAAANRRFARVIRQAHDSLSLAKRASMHGRLADVSAQAQFSNGYLSLNLLSRAHLRELLKATAACARGSGLPGAPIYAWVMLQVGGLCCELT